MLSFQLVGAAMAALVVTTAASAAGQLVPGSTAPADVVQRIKDVQAVQIGAATVRPVSQGGSSAQSAGQAGAKAQSAPTGGETTMVVRSSDNLVGVSSNDLVVIYKDTAAVGQALSGKPVSVQTWPALGMVIVHVSSFDQLGPLKAALSAKFPAAKFDLPIKYFDTLPK